MIGIHIVVVIVMKVLVVEDELSMQKALTKGLKKCGYAVDSADDGEAALELIEINTYDAIVLDLNLPKIDGIEVLKEIRKTNKDLRVLILSARSEVEDKIIGLDTGQMITCQNLFISKSSKPVSGRCSEGTFPKRRPFFHMAMSK